MTSYHDIKDERLIKLEQNKNCAPEHKRLILTRPIYISMIPNGYYMGSWATTIDLSYSPINYPLDDIESQTDKMDLIPTIDEIVREVKNKQPKIVYIKGGDPFFKYDEDVKELQFLLWEQGYRTIYEIPGCTLPQSIHSYTGEYIPSLIRIPVPLYREVVKDDEEYRWFIKHIKNNINQFHELTNAIELIFKIRDTIDFDEQIREALLFLTDIKLTEEISVIFTLDSPSLVWFPKLKNVMSTYLINNPMIKVQPDIRNIK